MGQTQFNKMIQLCTTHLVESYFFTQVSRRLHISETSHCCECLFIHHLIWCTIFNWRYVHHFLCRNPQLSVYDRLRSPTVFALIKKKDKTVIFITHFHLMWLLIFTQISRRLRNPGLHRCERLSVHHQTRCNIFAQYYNLQNLLH